MEYRALDIKVLEAKDLKDVNLFSKMDVYVVVTISGDPRTVQKTPVDKDGGTSPKWNFSMKFTVDDALAHQNRIGLNFTLRSNRALGDRDIGEVYVPLKELLDNASDDKVDRVVSFQVRRQSGKAQGTLSFSYKFGEKFSAPAPAARKADDPVMAYPAVAPGAGSSSAYAYPPAGGYPPRGAYPPSAGAYPHHAGAYPYPPSSGYPQGGVYGHPPQMGYGYGYGCPQQVQQPQKKKNKLGLGLGAGLLGGLLIGDMMGDVAGYDAGYDAGFDDGMDF
ncbi:protein SRC2 [Vitis riparia]|uniref:protein SRC2 n=1 Tax=Vitis riparia TaxID=96939 RepID=UPI00155A18E4|nr:protein SRC2 [Vitis riparia]